MTNFRDENSSESVLTSYVRPDRAKKATAKQQQQQQQQRQIWNTKLYLKERTTTTTIAHMRGGGLL
jgi:hypothetical protein